MDKIGAKFNNPLFVGKPKANQANFKNTIQEVAATKGLRQNAANKGGRNNVEVQFEFEQNKDLLAQANPFAKNPFTMPGITGNQNRSLGNA